MIVEGQKGNTKPQYQLFKFQIRPQIDGLRAISVTLVVICHLHIWLFKYGQVGVQIFFVISGYLITAVILRDLTRDRFSFRSFYQRRLKRIFPNLLLCSFTNFLIVSFYNLYEVKEASKSGLLSLLMIKNFQGKIPVKAYYQGHFWTLALEQQFYLLWPPAVPYLLRQSYKKQIIILVVFLLISFGFSAYRRFDYSTLLYAWNLILGCIIAFVQYQRQKKQKQQLNIKKSSEIQIQDWGLDIIKENNQIIPKNKQPQSILFKSILSTIAIIMIFILSQLGMRWLPFIDQKFEDVEWLFNVFGALCGFILVFSRGTYLSYLLSLRVLKFIGRQSYWIYVWHFFYIIEIEKMGIIWLKVLYLSLAVICGIFQDKVTNSKSKTTVYCIIGIYFTMIAILSVVYIIN